MHDEKLPRSLCIAIIGLMSIAVWSGIVALWLISGIGF